MEYYSMGLINQQSSNRIFLFRNKALIFVWGTENLILWLDKEILTLYGQFSKSKSAILLKFSISMFHEVHQMSISSLKTYGHTHNLVFS